MAKIIIKYTVDGVDELIHTYEDVDQIPDIDSVIDSVVTGFIDIIGEEPTREERRS